MSNKVQHIAEQPDMEAAMLNGTKVEVLCGKRIRPRGDLGDSVPICGPCVRMVVDFVSPAISWRDA